MILSETKLEENIKNKSFFKLYVFYGEEGFLIKKFVGKVVYSCVSKEFLNFNYKRCFFEDFSFDDLELFLNMPAFLYGGRVFVLKNFNFSKFNSKDVAKLEKILNGSCENNVLVIVSNEDFSQLKKTSSFNKISEYCSCCFVEFSFRSEDWLCRNFLKYLEKKGFSISYENLLFLVRRTNKSIERLNIELEKILAFVEKGEITKEHILALTSPEFFSNAFQITKYLLAGEKNKAIKTFNSLCFFGVNHMAIFSAISFCFLDLYRAKVASLKKIKPNEVLKYYDYFGKEFRIKNAMLNCKKYSIEKLRHYVVLLANLDVDLKSKNLPKNFLIEKLLFSI